jgi:hypothetical protein
LRVAAACAAAAAAAVVSMLAEGAMIEVLYRLATVEAEIRDTIMMRDHER